VSGHADLVERTRDPVPSSQVDALLATLLGDQGDRDSRLDRFCVSCRESLGVRAAVLTVAGRGEPPLVVAATDEPALRLQALELALGEGPSVDAQRLGGPVLVSDLRSKRRMTRWPHYSSDAAAAPWRAQFAYPLQIGAIRLGVLTLYDDRPVPLGDRQRSEALIYAEAATILLLHLQDVAGDGDGMPVEVERSFSSTAELHQATGMVAVQAAVGLAEALLLVRARAFSSGRTPLEVARDVLAGSLNFRHEDSHDG
jgi:hypothetical protein